MSRGEDSAAARRLRAVSLQVADPDLADRLRRVLAVLPGIELAEEDEAEIVIADAVPAEKVEAALIVLADGAALPDALRDGADAALPWDATRDDIRLAIDAVARGFGLVPADLLGALARGGEREGGPRAGEEAPLLTGREGEVLALLAAGASNKAIARRLGISVHTAKFHVASLLQKLEAVGRTDAVARGVRLGLILL